MQCGGMNYQLSLWLLLAIGVQPVLAQQESGRQPDRRLVYKKTDRGNLSLDIFQPKDWHVSDRRPCVVFFFGGGWVGGTTQQFYPQARHLADRGWVAISAQYRTRKSHGTDPYMCVEDGRDAIRWVRSHATELGVDATKVIAAGGSAGGHVAACTSFRPDQSSDANRNENAVSHVPEALILFNPVIDTSPNGFGNKTLGDRWRIISPVHNVSKATPPSVVFHGIADTTVPIDQVRAYAKNVKKLGGRCELVEYPDEKHAFFNYGRPSYGDTLVKMDVFLDSLWSTDE